MDRKLELYNILSHKFALKQMEERFVFEMEANKKIFNTNNISLAKLKRDCHNEEVFSQKEYKLIYEKSKKLSKKSSIINIQGDIITLGNDSIEDIDFLL